MGDRRWRPVTLVASREIKEKVSDRKFVLSTVALVLAVVGLVVAPALLQQEPSYSVGLAPSIRHNAGAALTTLDDATGMSVSVRETSEAVARRQLLDGDLDAYVASTTRVLLAGDPSDTLRTALQQALGGMAVRQTVIDHHLDPGVTQELLTAAS